MYDAHILAFVFCLDACRSHISQLCCRWCPIPKQTHTHSHTICICFLCICAHVSDQGYSRRPSADKCVQPTRCEDVFCIRTDTETRTVRCVRVPHIVKPLGCRSLPLQSACVCVSCVSCGGHRTETQIETSITHVHAPKRPINNLTGSRGCRYAHPPPLLPFRHARESN